MDSNSQPPDIEVFQRFKYSHPFQKITSKEFSVFAFFTIKIRKVLDSLHWYSNRNRLIRQRFVCTFRKSCSLWGLYFVLCYETLCNNLFLPNITKPTRITSHSKTLIDNIFSNISEQLFFSGNLTTPISDHLIQCAFFQAKTKRDTSNLKPKRDFRNFNDDQFQHEYSLIDWENVLQTNPDNIDDTLDAFLNT